MEKFKVRLWKEKEELSGRVEKLILFIGTDPFHKLTTTHRKLLRIQLASMKTYEQCLAERIDIL